MLFRSLTTHEDGHHLAIARELEREESRDRLFIVFADRGGSLGGRRKAEELVGDRVVKILPAAFRPRMELSRVPNNLSTIRVKSVFGCEVDKEGGTSLGEAEGVIVHSKNVGIDGRFDTMGRLVTNPASVQDVQDVRWFLDDTKSVSRTARVQHTVTCLDCRPYCNRSWSLKNGLRCFVVRIPVLYFVVIEEKANATKEHLPCRVQTGIV